MLADGTPPVLVVVEVNRALQNVLPLRDCRFDIGTWWLGDTESDRLDPDAALVVEGRESNADSLPDRPLALVAQCNGIVVGRYLLEPQPGRTAPREHRMAAVALADQAGAAIVIAPEPGVRARSTSPQPRARHRTSPPHNDVAAAAACRPEASTSARRTSVALLLAIVGPALTAVMSVPTRGWVDNTNVALILVVAVVACAASGQRAAALVAALWFNYLHTRPYYSLTIHARDDIVTTLLLLTVAMAVAELVLRARQARAHASRHRDHIGRIHAVSQLVVLGEKPAFVVIAAATQLRDLLDIADVRFEPAPALSELPTLNRAGRIVEVYPRAVPMDLPPTEIALPITSAGSELGRFVLCATPGAVPAPEALLAAVALADQVGTALAAATAPRS